MEKNGGGARNCLEVEERKGEVDNPTAQPEGKGAIDVDEGSVEWGHCSNLVRGF
jgi:hypothetical protein